MIIVALSISEISFLDIMSTLMYKTSIFGRSGGGGGWRDKLDFFAA